MSLDARRWLLPLLPAVIFLGFGLTTLPDYGMTWDEAESWNAAASNLEMLRGSGPPWAATHVLPGYYFAVDTLRALFVEAVGAVVPLANPDDIVAAQHAFNLLMASASVALLSVLVLQICGRSRMALYAGGALALMPPFVGHSQNNPKDLPAVFAFLLAASCLVGLANALGDARGRRAGRWVAAGALALGLALTTRLLCVALIPIFAIWLTWRRREVVVRGMRAWLGLAAAAGVAAIALWPWLWQSPFSRLREILDRIAIHQLVDFQIVYLGDLLSWTQMPWHYRPVHLLVALPLVHLLLALLAAAAALRWRSTRDSRLDVVTLAASWLAVLAIVDQLAPYRYDGLRHLLPVLPAVAMWLAAGAEWLSDQLHDRLGRIASPRLRAATAELPVALAAALAAMRIVSIHPYQSAHMNVIANAIAGPQSEEWLELEYWGQAYAEGGRWLDQNAESNAVVYLPIGEKVAGYHVRRQHAAWKLFESRFEQSPHPQYVMFITRLGFYDAGIQRLERDHEPVYSLRVQNATLLKIYRNRASRPDATERRRG